VPCKTDPAGPFFSDNGDGGLHLGDLFGIVGCRKFTLALPVSGKIKSQGQNVFFSQFLAGLTDNAGMPGAGETMTKNHPAPGRPFGQMERTGKFFALLIIKINGLFHE
jgi:hypothetical protein